MADDAARLDWLESAHTLHNSVEILYVVDGYELIPLRDGNQIGAPVHGGTLRDAIDKARVQFSTEVSGE